MFFRFPSSVVVAISCVLTMFLTKAQSSALFSNSISVGSFSTVFLSTGVPSSSTISPVSNITSTNSSSIRPVPTTSITSLAPSSSILSSKSSSSTGNGLSATVSASSSGSSPSTTSLPIIAFNWGTATPTSTAGVTKATHDSHGFPILPPHGPSCWFCPPSGGGSLISGVKGPGIIKPPSGNTKPPPGFSSGMPAITLDSAGNPSYDKVSPTSTGVSRTGSSQTVPTTISRTGSSQTVPTTASSETVTSQQPSTTGSVASSAQSSINSTISSQAPSTTGSATSSAQNSITGTFSPPPLGSADADPMLYEETLAATMSTLPLAVSIERAISSLEAFVTNTTTSSPPITTTSPPPTTSAPPSSPPPPTTTAPPPSPPPPTTTAPPPPASTTVVPKCWTLHDAPAQDLSSIVSDWPTLFSDYCVGKSMAGTSEGKGIGSGPPSNNYIQWDFASTSNAPPECSNIGAKSFDTQNMDYCTGPMNDILKACPFNGGVVETSCGTTLLQTCPVGDVCAEGKTGG